MSNNSSDNQTDSNGSSTTDINDSDDQSNVKVGIQTRKILCYRRKVSPTKKQANKDQQLQYNRKQHIQLIDIFFSTQKGVQSRSRSNIFIFNL